MKVSELKISQEVEINGHIYFYKGIQKIRKSNFGKIQQVVFEPKSEKITVNKYFDLSIGNKDLKVHENGKIEMK